MPQLAKRIIIIFFLIFLSANLFAESKKILVLGFESEQLNDIQTILLRNAMLRSLYEKGYDIVSIMDVESIMIKDKGLKAVRLGKKDLEDYCAEVNSGYSMIGRIYPVGKKKLNEIKSGHQFTCDILLYQKKTEKFMNFKFNIEGKDLLYDFYSDIADKVVLTIGTKIKK